MTMIERFMSRVEMVPEAGCWIWMGKLNGQGYGEFRPAGTGQLVLAHRLSYVTFVGELGALHALHCCDVRCCVNPHHLFAGTHQDNMADMVAKGRSGHRSGGGFSGIAFRKLATDDHKAIAASPASSKELAALYGVHYTHINWIRRKESKVDSRGVRP